MADAFRSVEWDPAAKALFRRTKPEAEALGDDFVGTAHLLLAAVATTPVEQHGIPALTHDAVRDAVLAVTGPRDPDVITISPGAQSPRFKRAIEHAMRRAFGQSRPVCCRDVWYGLLADPESEAVRVLRHLGIPVEEARGALSD
jgi:hypothetical protein